MESLLAVEIKRVGGKSIRPVVAGVAFVGKLEAAYRLCLWSRIASRVILPLANFQAKNSDILYDHVKKIPWEKHLTATGSFSVDFTGTNQHIRHTRFGAQRVKDAVVDRFREQGEDRPSVEFEEPDIRINVRLNKRDQVALGLDLSGDSLHRRGYRLDPTLAPLKENLAAALLTLSGWPEVLRVPGPLLDPMCGSGTLAIEAAMMAGNRAPGLYRSYFGFLRWLGHDQDLWRQLNDQAIVREEKGEPWIPPIYGSDSDESAVCAARENVRRAGLSSFISIEKRDLSAMTPPEGASGLIIANPPYGTRQGFSTPLDPLYQLLGGRLKNHFQGWRAGVFSGNEEMEKWINLPPVQNHKLFNGALPCTLLTYQL